MSKPAKEDYRRISAFEYIFMDVYNTKSSLEFNRQPAGVQFSRALVHSVAETALALGFLDTGRP